MNYYLIVLPMAKDGSVNRQILALSDYESAKQAFHFQCGKYFKNDGFKMASVCVIDDYCNRLLYDYWTEEKEPTEEEIKKIEAEQALGEYLANPTDENLEKIKQIVSE